MGDVSPGGKDPSPPEPEFHASNWSFRDEKTGKLKKRWTAIVVAVGVLLTTMLVTVVAHSCGLMNKRPRSAHTKDGGPSDNDADGSRDRDETPKPFVPKLAHLVQPLMGVEGGGNMFPGVCMPYGVVKLGIDMLPPAGAGDAYSGYYPRGRVKGFSMMHESGTGGAPKYGVVSQYPATGALEDPLVDHAVARAAPDEAALGWYKASLEGGITVELAASHHAGIVKHTFPAVATNASVAGNHVIVDVSYHLQSFRGQGIGQNYVEGSIKVDSNGYEGYGVYNGGWNLGENWKIYFCGKFRTIPVQVRTFSGTGQVLESYGGASAVSGTKRVGAVFSFGASRNITDPLVVESDIGISFISTEKACKFIQSEIPANQPFRTLVNSTKQAWEEEVLSTVSTTETDDAKLKLLYSAVYGMYIVPSNRTGENPKWESSEPYYDDTFTFWDLFRSHAPLMHIIQPGRYEEYIRSTIDIWRHDGYTPDGRSSNFNGRVQGGSNADNVLADAYVKGVRGRINWEDGFKAMVKNAEITPENNNDQMAPDSSTKEGRGALPDWLERGYITTKYSRSVSRASEYALNDFALSQVAKGLGKTAEYDKYLMRSRNWRNQWDNNSMAFGGEFTGFLSPRDINGNFPTPPQDPLSCGGCYWRDAYYQALPFEYSFGAHHDMETLIKYMGGEGKFVARLEKMFEPGQSPTGSPRFGKTIFNPGNEPSFATPYLFNYAGRQDLTVEKSRYIAKTYYNSGPQGLPGNSDAGAMQSWLVWNMLGLYPITGTTTFLIASPWFSNLTLSLGSPSKTVKITSTGGSETNFFVQSVKLNGNNWVKNWLSWGDLFEKGGTLEFVLGAERTKWDTGERPPSFAT
ncbi:glycosyl hydrolase family 92-domain-containing protein [Tuber brumale]|nr:glycosyl hydrolase family 92-domain-containing protein [Tuber brumale]